MIMPSKEAVIALGAFATAAALALGTAFASVRVIEAYTRDTIADTLQEGGIAWAEVHTDGLLVVLEGTGPTEAERFRALSLVNTLVDATRVIDLLEVEAATEVAPPSFRLELLRNRDEVSVIGLVPLRFGRDDFIRDLTDLSDQMIVADMLEASDHPLPDTWDPAVTLAMAALKLLPVSKVSVGPGQVRVAALAESADAKRRLERQLQEVRPRGVALELEISAPRPVLAPFTLRFTIEDGTPRFDACAADTQSASANIAAAARRAGLTGGINCTLGLGAPSPQWGQAASLGIRELGTLGAGTITLSDSDISLVVPHTIASSAFDQAVGTLESQLPEGFSLRATRLDPPADTAADPDAVTEFVASLSPEGQVLLRGRLTDARIRDTVHSYARARFGSGAVQMAARLEPDLPEGWPLKSLTAVEALAELHSGVATVREDRIELRGVSGNRNSSDAISRIFADQIEQGVDLRIAVSYDERLDPVAMAPTPERCEASISEILAEEQITFGPGSTSIDSAAGRTLDRIADVLRECGALEMEIAGYTDSQGRAETNLSLSQRRAEAVLDGLILRQVLTSGMEARGYGEADPIADNATASGREANRRIEFRLIRPEEPEAEIPTERDPELEAQLEIAAQDADEDTPRPVSRPARD